MVVDSAQVLSRIPPNYFLKKESAADVFDGLFGPRSHLSLSEECKVKLAKQSIELDFLQPKDLTEARLQEANVVVILDSTDDSLLERVKSIQRRVLFVYESVIMDPKAHRPDYQNNFTSLFSYALHKDLPGLPIFPYQYPVREEMQFELVPFDQRSFCCMIASSKTSNWTQEALRLRESFIRFFSAQHSDKFDLWGGGWDKTGHAHSLIIKGLFEGSKHDLMRKYRFSFCPENIGTVDNYITEKIWHAFHNGVVPIYLGPPNVDDFIPKSCYIDLRDYMTESGEIDGQRLYNEMNAINAERFEVYLRTVREFLNSEKARRFSPEVFTETFARALHTVIQTQV